MKNPEFTKDTSFFDFPCTLLDGTEVARIGDLCTGAKVTLVVVTASMCRLRLTEMPELVEIHSKYRS